MLPALRQGWPQELVAASWAKRLRTRGRRAGALPITGVSEFADLGAPGPAAGAESVAAPTRMPRRSGRFRAVSPGRGVRAGARTQRRHPGPHAANGRACSWRPSGGTTSSPAARRSPQSVRGGRLLPHPRAESWASRRGGRPRLRRQRGAAGRDLLERQRLRRQLADSGGPRPQAGAGAAGIYLMGRPSDAQRAAWRRRASTSSCIAGCDVLATARARACAWRREASHDQDPKLRRRTARLARSPRQPRGPRPSAPRPAIRPSRSPGPRPKASRSRRSTPRPTPPASISCDTWPGLPPFLRGPYPTMYTTQPWTIRQYAGFSTAEDSNAFYRRNLAAGQKGLSVAFDLATHRGYDSDHPRVAGDVGMAGVAIDSILDMEILFSGIPLDQMSVSMTMNGAVLPVLALYIVAAEEQGVPAGAAQRHHPERHPQGVHGPQHLHLPAGALDADRLGHLRLHGEAHAEVQLDQHFRLPHAGGRGDRRPGARLHPGRRRRVRPLRPCRRPRRRRLRAAPVVLLGDRHELLHGGRQAARRAPALGQAGPASSSPRNPKSLALRTHCQTSGWSLTAQDVFNNVARTCIEAMAAAHGHTQSLHTNALDEALALPTDFSARIARNTQLFIQQETGITRTIDPWGGSYYVERLTYDLAAAGLEPHRGGRGLGRHGASHRAGHPQAAHRGGGGPHPGPDRRRPADAWSASTSTARPRPRTIPVLKVDNSAVRARQIEKLRAAARRARPAGAGAAPSTR